LKKEGLDVKLVQLDVTDPNSIKAARDVIQKAEGKLDVLVNNAGIPNVSAHFHSRGSYTTSFLGAAFLDRPQSATTVDVADIRAAFEPNFFGLIQTTTTLLPLLRKSSRAVILNVTTDMASTTHQARPDSSLHVVAYNTSKAAANSYTVALAHELRREGIKVNCVTPGFTSTKLNSYGQGGKTPVDGAKVLLPWALLGADGPTGMIGRLAFIEISP
jgi:NAD(P)-dependent dehydrogenase (short-subunit alcohol dehydrogenase family)